MNRALPRRSARVTAGVACTMLVIAATLATADLTAADGGTRVTTRFALKQVRPALQRVAKLCTQGFDRVAADKLAAEIEALPTEKSGNWQINAHCGGQSHTIAVRALIDELSRADLDFATDAAMTALIREALGDLADGLAGR